jgi:hypothetical protein
MKDAKESLERIGICKKCNIVNGNAWNIRNECLKATHETPLTVRSKYVSDRRVKE